MSAIHVEGFDPSFRYILCLESGPGWQYMLSDKGSDYDLQSAKKEAEKDIGLLDPNRYFPSKQTFHHYAQVMIMLCRVEESKIDPKSCEEAVFWDWVEKKWKKIL